MLLLSLLLIPDVVVVVADVVTHLDEFSFVKNWWFYHPQNTDNEFSSVKCWVVVRPNDIRLRKFPL